MIQQHSFASNSVLVVDLINRLRDLPQYAYSLLTFTELHAELDETFQMLRNCPDWAVIKPLLQHQLRQLICGTLSETLPSGAIERSSLEIGTDQSPLLAGSVSGSLSQSAANAPKGAPSDDRRPRARRIRAKVWKCPKKDCPKRYTPYCNRGHFVNHLKNVHNERDLSPDQFLVDADERGSIAAGITSESDSHTSTTSSPFLTDVAGSDPTPVTSQTPWAATQTPSSFGPNGSFDATMTVDGSQLPVLALTASEQFFGEASLDLYDADGNPLSWDNEAAHRFFSRGMDG